MVNPVVLICLRSSYTRDHWGGALRNEWTSWATVQEATQVLESLCTPRCGPYCEGAHVAVWTDEDGTQHVFGDSRPPPTLNEVYPPNWYRSDTLPLAPDFNEPLDAAGVLRTAEKEKENP